MRRALRADAAAEALTAGAREMRFRDVASIQLPLPERRRRVAVLLRTLAEVRGGAQRAMHYGYRLPAFACWRPQGRNNPFTRVLTAPDSHVRFDQDTFTEELSAWAGELDGPVLIGWSPGFLGDQREQARRALACQISAAGLVIDHPRTVLRSLADQVEAGQHDAWFEDPAA